MPGSHPHLLACPRRTAAAALPNLRGCQGHPPGSAAVPTEPCYRLHRADPGIVSSSTSVGSLRDRDHLYSAGFPSCVQHQFSHHMYLPNCPLLVLKQSSHVPLLTALLGLTICESASGLMLPMCFFPAYFIWKACKPAGEAGPTAAQMCQERHQAWSWGLKAHVLVSASHK